MALDMFQIDFLIGNKCGNIILFPCINMKKTCPINFQSFGLFMKTANIL